ncbi:hypothetical protein SAMN05216226_101316 [Halovenus aranensis]|jgi:hypothetical protein|uniref:Uncharacterized protein n=1 Tax=Halovenus aranensis TaxID=890420 RepID=A0A1G8S6S7_9EURY|nr:hypothetical protein [Halovenus aranensis]SDJ24929.1 hypothetical protein SAMN05216226_101316 [Halovenus aranensis]
MVSKKTLTAGIAVAVVLAYTLSRWKSSPDPIEDEVEHTEP